jgi:hypothetical protein
MSSTDSSSKTVGIPPTRMYLKRVWPRRMSCVADVCNWNYGHLLLVDVYAHVPLHAAAHCTPRRRKQGRNAVRSALSGDIFSRSGQDNVCKALASLDVSHAEAVENEDDLRCQEKIRMPAYKVGTDGRENMR